MTREDAELARMLSFALKTLLADRSKLLTGLLGVIFSMVLVNVQGGLYLGLMRKASLLVDHCDAQLWVTYRQVENVDASEWALERIPC